MDKDAIELRQLLIKVSQINKAYNDIQRPFKVKDEKQKDVYGKEHIILSRVRHVLPLMQACYKSQLATKHQQLKKTCATDAVNLLKEYLTNEYEKPSLLLYGPPGTGKTTLINCIHRTISALYADQISVQPLFMIAVKAQSLGEVAKTDKSRYDNIKKCRILFLDDLGFYGETESVNDYGTKIKPTEEIISYRYDRSLTTFATSNLNDNELRAKYGERIYSRMREQYKFLAIVGLDQRQQ